MQAQTLIIVILKETAKHDKHLAMSSWWIGGWMKKESESGSRKEPLKETHSNQRNPRDGLCDIVLSSKQIDELARILANPRTERSS
jgi:hypothetical protein